MSAEKFASFNWMRAVSDDKRISVIHRLILLRLCLHRRNDGRCDPGCDLVALELGVHRTTILRAIDAGIGLGWMTAPIRRRRANADFIFTFPQEVALGATSRSRSRSRSIERHQDDQEVAPGDLRSRSKGSKKSLKKVASSNKSSTSTRNGAENGRREREKSKTQTPPSDLFGDGKSEDDTSSKTDLAEPFARFWAAYPRRVAKEAARKAFAAAVDGGADAETLIAGALRYAAERASQDPKYTKHPSTWLRAGCWTDEPPGGVVIDQHGNAVAVVERPRRREREPTWDEIEADAIAGRF
jgi:hypothetical protein